jgi:hypothetical protein
MNDADFVGDFGMRSPHIDSGTARIAGCGLRTSRHIAEGDVEFILTFWYRCLPFVAACHRTGHWYFRQLGSTWVEGEDF